MWVWRTMRAESRSANASEARASPVGRGFWRMACGPGCIPCRIARPGGPGHAVASSAPSRQRPPAALPGGFRSVQAGRPAPRASGSTVLKTCFGPERRRPAIHPSSTAPTTRHDLASVRRTRGRYHRADWRGQDRGTRAHLVGAPAMTANRARPEIRQLRWRSRASSRDPHRSAEASVTSGPAGRGRPVSRPAPVQRHAASACWSGPPGRMTRPESAASTVTVWPSTTRPARISSASPSCTWRWMTRFSGRAP